MVESVSLYFFTTSDGLINIYCSNLNTVVKLLMAATHIKNGNDGWVVPPNDVGNIFGLWDLGGYQLYK